MRIRVYYYEFGFGVRRLWGVWNLGVLEIRTALEEYVIFIPPSMQLAAAGGLTKS